MACFKAEIHVTLKRTVNDPQGLTIAGGLRSLGFGGVESVRAGKYLEVWMEAGDEAEASSAVESMCERLLANLVIENYRYAVRVEAGDGTSTASGT